MKILTQNLTKLPCIDKIVQNVEELGTLYLCVFGIKWLHLLLKLCANLTRDFQGDRVAILLRLCFGCQAMSHY